MRTAEEWLAGIGIAIPGTPALIQAAVALGFVLLALAAGWFAGRRLGPTLTEFWRTRLGVHAEGVGQRLPRIVRHGTAAVLLAILAKAWPWPPLAALGIGLALGAAAAAALVQILRGVGLARWITWTVATLAFVAILSQAVGGLDPITSALDSVGIDVGKRRLSLLSVLTVVITVILLYAVVRIANRAIGHALGQARGLDPTQRLLGQKLAGVTLIVFAFFFGIDLLGIDLTTFAVFSGALGLAIGFGMQKTIGNLIAGIILLMDRSIKPGDVIAVGDRFGWVNKIGVRAVSVITREGKEHLIPNELLMTQEVENWSYSDRNVRIGIKVTINYHCDVELAQKLMLRAATESARVLDSPKPVVWLLALGDNGLEHEIRVWISDPEGGVGSVTGDVLTRLWVLFKQNDITVATPRRDIRLTTNPVGAAAPSA